VDALELTQDFELSEPIRAKGESGIGKCWRWVLGRRNTGEGCGEFDPRYCRREH
jgi:hypothetical protein